MNWKPTASLENLRIRSNILTRVRRFFEEHGFCEVQTPTLSRDTVVDRHLDPIHVDAHALGLPKSTWSDQTKLFLQTSPEFAMKRLMAAGMDAIYQIGPAFRSGELGSLHNTEFTMLEWYRAGDDFEAGVRMLEQIVDQVTPWPAATRQTYQSVFEETVGCDPLTVPMEELAAIAYDCLDVAPDWSTSRDDWLDLILSELVQPNLGCDAPVILTHYPASQSALAKLAADGRTAERFELFYRGIELANGYHELVDASELLSRNEKVNSQRKSDGKATLPTRSFMLQAMEAGLPECSGCALGFDRLVMLLAGATRIAEVMAFPIERA